MTPHLLLSRLFPTAAPRKTATATAPWWMRLTSSRIYRDYERAFGDMTGLPIALQPVETWQLPHHGKRNENAFCALLSKKSRACAAAAGAGTPVPEGRQRGGDRRLPGGPERQRRAGAHERPAGRLPADRPGFRKKPTEAQFNKCYNVQEWGWTPIRSRCAGRISPQVITQKEHDSAVSS